jgi:antitoxin PrlF
MDRQTATITSKGQITIPREVRRRLGLKPGDRVDFVTERGRTILGRTQNGPNPFEAYIGALPAFRNKREIHSWIAEMRDDRPRKK